MTADPRKTAQTSSRSITVEEIQVMVIVDASCLKTGGLAAQVMWLGLRVGGRLALLYIHQMNRVNSRNDLVMTTAL